MSNNIESILQELTNKIGGDKVNNSNTSYFHVKPIYVYGGVPIVLLFLFLLIRPNFIKKKDDKTGNNIIDMKKVILITIIFSLIIDIGLYVYLYSKNK